MEYIVFTVAILCLLGIMVVRELWNAKVEKKKFVLGLKNNYGSLPERTYKIEEFLSCRKYFEKHQEENQIDEITWNDLAMDDVYKKLNYTFSSAGDEYLYYLLRTPSYDRIVLQKRESLIQYFSKDEEERIRLQCIFHQLGRIGKYSIYDYLDHLSDLGVRSNWKHWIVNILYILGIFICFFKPYYGVLVIAILAVYNIIVYFREKSEIEPYIISFGYILRLLNATDEVLKTENTVYREDFLKLQESRKRFLRFRTGSFWIMSSNGMTGSMNPLDLLLDYCRMSFHIDLMKFNSMLSEVRKHRKEIDCLITEMGYLESMIAIGAYRKSLKEGYCVPGFEENSRTLKLCEGYHPLLKNPVKNSISGEKGILLTGSNASGKSTFLRMVAINALFSQTIHTCLAKEYKGDFFQVVTSMSLKDDLVHGESYYIVEIKSIKRILEKAQKNKTPVLCFVDEVLRGTNTVERIAAATQILKCLMEGKVLCFAATHDLELAQLLESQYENYHFEEEIVDGDIRFCYQLLPGKATTRNAIQLLSIMGYQEDIIKKAERMAETFLKEGVWKV